MNNNILCTYCHSDNVTILGQKHKNHLFTFSKNSDKWITWVYLCNNCGKKFNFIAKKDEQPAIIENTDNTIAKNEPKENVNLQNKKGSLLDVFNTNKYKVEIDKLRSENLNLKQKLDFKLTFKQMEPNKLDDLISSKKQELEQLKQQIQNELDVKEQNVIKLKSEASNYSNKIEENITRLNELKAQIIDVSDQIEYESYGLYKPRYNFADSPAYKSKLSEVRSAQKQMIKNKNAGEIILNITFNGSYSKGKRIQEKNIKQLIRSFNGECEAAINKVTKSNIATIEKRIERSFTQLNKLNEGNGIKITTSYYDSKIDEAHIALEYALKKEQERELLREQRQREREEKKLQQEIANERAKYEKDESHFENAKKEVTAKLNHAKDDNEIASLKSELAALQNKIDEINAKKEKLQNRADNPTAGYVYIISNIGSFGKNVYKIGVTRRLDPMERINELGSASVPFKFDVHALIFSDDAFKLETELHNYFDKERVNRVNKHKEYFKITIDEIKEILAKHKNLTFDFHEIPDAIEYRDTLKLSENNNFD